MSESLSQQPPATSVSLADKVVVIQGTTPTVDRTATVAQLFAAGTFTLAPATTSTLGGSIYPSPGGLSVDVSGNVTLNAATGSVIGGVKVGANITNTSGVISVSQAGTATLGVVQVPASGNLVVDGSGNLSVTQAGTATLGVAEFPASGGLVVSGGGSVSLNGTQVLTGPFTLSTNNALKFTGQTNGAASSVGTLTNAPHAANPVFWLPVMINGTACLLPAWAA